MKIQQIAVEILCQTKRLERADTPRKVLNAKRKILGLLRRARNELCKKTKLKKSAFCPLCDVPMKNFATLANHMLRKHGCAKNYRAKCPCGFVSKGKGRLARHLSGQADLKTHLAMATIGEPI